MLGTYRVNQQTEEVAERKRSLLPDTEETPELAGKREQVNFLAAAVPGFLERIEKTRPDEVSTVRLPNLAIQFGEAQTGGAVADPKVDPWLEIIEDLVLLSGGGRDGLMEAALATYVASHFDPLLIAIFKEDATGRGPFQGRGWAALTLLFWGRMFSGVQEVMAQGSAMEGNLRTQLAELEARLQGKVEELARWHGSETFGVANGGLAQWLGSLNDRLVCRIDELKGLVGHGLISPEEFRRRYWKEPRQDPRRKTLW